MYDVLGLLGFIFSVFACAGVWANYRILMAYTSIIKMKALDQSEQTKKVATGATRGSTGISQQSHSDTSAQSTSSTGKQEVKQLSIETLAPNLSTPPISRGGFGSKEKDSS